MKQILSSKTAIMFDYMIILLANSITKLYENNFCVYIDAYFRLHMCVFIYIYLNEL